MGLVMKRVEGSTKTTEYGPAPVIPSYQTNLEDVEKNPLLWIFGYQVDNGKVLRYLNSTMPILPLPEDPAELDIFLERTKEIIHLAELFAWRLGVSFKKIGRANIPVISQFWDIMESPFYQTLSELAGILGDSPAMVSLKKEWGSRLSQEILKPVKDYILSGSLDESEYIKIARVVKETREFQYTKKVKEIIG